MPAIAVASAGRSSPKAANPGRPTTTTRRNSFSREVRMMLTDTAPATLERMAQAAWRAWLAWSAGQPGDHPLKVWGIAYHDLREPERQLLRALAAAAYRAAL